MRNSFSDLHNKPARISCGHQRHCATYEGRSLGRGNWLDVGTIPDMGDYGNIMCELTDYEITKLILTGLRS